MFLFWGETPDNTQRLLLPKLKGYYWLCIQKLLLEVLKESYEILEIEPGSEYSKEAFNPLSFSLLTVLSV